MKIWTILVLFVVVVVRGEKEEPIEDWVWTYQEPDADGNVRMVRARLPEAGKPWSEGLRFAEEAIERGHIGEALERYQHILERFTLPERDQFLVHLAVGTLLGDESRSMEAETSLHLAASAASSAHGRGWNVETHLSHYALGVTYARAGQTQEAVASLQRCLFFRPEFGPALHDLGVLRLVVDGDWEGALDLFARAAESFEAFGNSVGVGGKEEEVEVVVVEDKSWWDGVLGYIFGEVGGMEKETSTENNPIELEPHQLLPWLLDHVTALFRASKAAPPVSTLPRAAGIGPWAVEAWNESPLRRGGRVYSGEELGRMLRRICQHESPVQDRFALHMNLGMQLWNVGLPEAGSFHLQEARRLNPQEKWIDIFLALALPVVVEHPRQVLLERAGLHQRIRKLLDSSDPPEDPDKIRELYHSVYTLPFYGLPIRETMMDIARVFARSRLPLVPYHAPDLRSPTPHKRWMEQTRKPPKPEEEHPILLDGALQAALQPTVPKVPHGSTVRVTIVTTQLYDNPVGHLLRRLLEEMGTYTDVLQTLHKQADYFEEGGDFEEREDFVVGKDFEGGEQHPKNAKDFEGGEPHPKNTKDFEGGEPHPKDTKDFEGGEPHPKNTKDFEEVAPPAKNTNDFEEVAPPAKNTEYFEEVAPYRTNRKRSEVEFCNVDVWALGRCGGKGVVVDGAGTGVDRPGMVLRGSGRAAYPKVSGFHSSVVLLRRMGDAVTRAALRAADSVRSVEWRETVGGPRPNGTREATRRQLTALRRTVLQTRPDVLIFADSGMDPFVHAATQSRLAPVQIALWGGGGGHSLTLGTPDTIDYLVGADGAWSNDADAACAEQTVRLGAGPGLFFPRLHMLNESEYLHTIASVPLLAHKNYYLVPRVLIGIQPPMDPLFARILELDPDAEILILHESSQRVWLAKLRSRLASHPSIGPSRIHRIRFIREQPRRGMWALALAAAVVIDPFPVGLGISALEIIALGTPILTCPSLQPPPVRHIAAAALNLLQIPHLVCPNHTRNARDFATTVVQLATNRTLRAQTRALLRARSHRLEWNDTLVNNTQTHTSIFPLLNSSSPTLDLKTPKQLPEQTLHDWISFLARVGTPFAWQRQHKN